MTAGASSEYPNRSRSAVKARRRTTAGRVIIASASGIVSTYPAGRPAAPGGRCEPALPATGARLLVLRVDALDLTHTPLDRPFQIVALDVAGHHVGHDKRRKHFGHGRGVRPGITTDERVFAHVLQVR